MAPTDKSYLLALSKEAMENSGEEEMTIVLDSCIYRICLFVDGSRQQGRPPQGCLQYTISSSAVHVELCMSIKSIQYVLKYVNKGCDMAVFLCTRS